MAADDGTAAGDGGGRRRRGEGAARGECGGEPGRARPEAARQGQRRARTACYGSWR